MRRVSITFGAVCLRLLTVTIDNADLASFKALSNV